MTPHSCVILFLLATAPYASASNGSWNPFRFMAPCFFDGGSAPPSESGNSAPSSSASSSLSMPFDFFGCGIWEPDISEGKEPEDIATEEIQNPQDIKGPDGSLTEDIQIPQVHSNPILKDAFKKACAKVQIEDIKRLLKREELQAADVREAFFEACHRGLCHGDPRRAITLLLKDGHVDNADVIRGFRLACSLDNGLVVSHLLKDKRIGPDDVKDAFRQAIGDGKLFTIIALMKDKRLDSTDIDNAFRKYRRESDMIHRFLKDPRLSSPYVNQGFRCLEDNEAWHFIGDSRLEPRIVGEFLKDALRKGRYEHHLTRLLQDKPKAYKLGVVRKELALLLPTFPKQISALLQKGLLEIMDFDFAHIRRAAEKKPDVVVEYANSLQRTSADINLYLVHPPSTFPMYVARIPLLSLHMFNALQMLLESSNDHYDISCHVIELTRQLHLLNNGVKFKHDIPYLELARTSLHLAPQPLLSAIDKILLSADLSRMDSKQKALFDLHGTFVDTPDGLLSRDDYYASFEEYINNELAGRPDALRTFLQLHMRPEMSSKEMEKIRAMIQFKLERSPKSGISLDDIYNRTSPELIDWIKAAWRGGNRELVNFIVEGLRNHWEIGEMVDQLVMEIVERNKDLAGLGLYVVGDLKSEVVLRLLQKDTIKSFQMNLYIANVPLEEIHELPLTGEDFFGPSIACLSNRKETGLDSAVFRIKYYNEEGGTDLGGPTRNWIEKMLHAMADPRRQFLKAHGSKGQLVPDIFVDSKMFFALGRLIGKGIAKDAGLPFAFHPKWVQLLKEPREEAFLRECFEEFYEEELRMMNGLLSYIESDDFDDILEKRLAPLSEWRLTSESGVRNIMNFTKAEESDSMMQIFHPESGEEIQEYVTMATKLAFSKFQESISSFLEGLGIYVKTELLPLVKMPTLLKILSPSPDIDVDSMLAAFKFQAGDGVTVQISEDDLASIGEHVVIMGSADSNGPSRISVFDAFKIALRKLKPLDLLPGLLGQLSGSKSAGFTNFRQGMFTVVFTPGMQTRSLFGEGPSSSSSERLKLPKASSCTLTVYMPCYRTLKEFCYALELLAKASDDFYHA